ncbi:NUDIX hydrolase [Limnofasciculus baicalensis]|uniref:NUDIX hydrolase n=1 Tax=Limnofasciculus baicalensis BBK-W-15 TaxID=2699891 RepID=A0AAE3KNV5_9CYAN|nr:NUDIX hydrolase [Limnofasciculus baicalensis]MCP2730920.1 NUDIX hydrolase [Limnofasciculus baicalensis BBK-W-15]
METINFPDELLDIVDEQDNVIGQKRRSSVYRECLYNFRVVNAFVVNSKGQLWIPRRTYHKITFPGCLDFSMGGHVESGETYEAAFAREIKEELGWDLDQIEYIMLGYLTPLNHQISAFMKVYEIKSEESPNYNNNDFLEYFWLTPQELLTRIAKGEAGKDDLPKLVRLFYSD